jgi:ABC-2 type transport system permease protein
MIGVWVMAWREVLRFFRQPSRLFGSLVQPLLFWLFMGSGFGDSLVLGGATANYAEFFYPGIVVMLLLFAAIFSTITLIEDRNAGFLQGVLVAPVSRLSLVVGKLLGGTAIAWMQATVFLCFIPLAGIEIGIGQIGVLLGLFVLIGVGFTGMGFAVAWFMDTVSGYHAIMSVVMIPMWLMSGALFPVEGAAFWLGALMRCNPVSYALQLVRTAFYTPPAALMSDSTFVSALIVCLLWGVATIGVSLFAVKKRTL